MNKRIRIRVVFIGFFWTAVALCGCARREPDMPEEFLLPAEEEAEGDVQAGCRNGEDAYGMTGDTKQDAFTGSEEVSRNGEAGTFTLPGQQECYVYICGAVKEPGVYRMETDARVFAVIDKAGGFAEGACEDYVNQAKPVADGLRIWIPTLQEAEEARGGTGMGGHGMDENAGLDYPGDAGAAGLDGSGPGLVDINVASEAELCTLPGIGETKAKAIVEYRNGQGSFEKKEDIMKVAGIKQSGYDKIKDQITVNRE